jgi:glycogen synthase
MHLQCQKASHENFASDRARFRARMTPTLVRPEDLHVLVLARAVLGFHGVGGLERHVRDLVRHLLQRGARVTLVTRPGPAGAASSLALPNADRLSVRNVPYVTFPFGGLRGTTALDRSSAYLLFGWRAGRLAADLVNRGGIDIVHGMGAASLGYAQSRRRDWSGTVPFVFNPHGMEEFGSTGPGLGLLKRAAYAPLRSAVRACAHSADRVIATDRVLIPTVLKHLEIPETRVSVVPNAVDLDEIDRLSDARDGFAIRERLGLGSEDPLLVAVGRLEENKGFQYLVAALAQLARDESGPLPLGARWRCVILGEGSYRPRLERDIVSAGLGGTVLLPGRVGDGELHPWYEAATLFVHPTLYEGSSIVTLEAMAHRRAVVASRAGGLPDKIRPDTNGWLVAPGDPNALARAVDEALEDRDRLRHMGDESRRIVENEFAWSVVAGQLLALYAELRRGRSAQPSTRSLQEP